MYVKKRAWSYVILAALSTLRHGRKLWMFQRSAARCAPAQTCGVLAWGCVSLGGFAKHERQLGARSAGGLP